MIEANDIKFKKSLWIKTFGTSMFPVLHDEDIIKIQKMPFSRVKENDIICYKKNKNLITHRVIYKSKRYVICKGDNSATADKRVDAKNILGIITEVKRQNQQFSIRDIYLLQSTIYWEEIKKISSLFDKNKIRFVFLKGLPVYLHYEQKHPQRIYADCDILISKKDYKRVERLLLKNKFTKENELSVTGEKMSDKAEYSFYKIVNNFPVVFDIHKEAVFLMTRVGEVNHLYPQNLLDELTQTLLKENEYVDIDGKTYPILKKEYLFVYLCLHLFNHNYKGVHRYDLLRGVIDTYPDINKTKLIINRFKLDNFVFPAFLIYKKYYPSQYIEKLKNSIDINPNLKDFINKIVNSLNIFDDTDVVGEGKHFKLLFYLSPNPIWKKVLVFMDGKVLYSILWVLAHRIKIKR